MQSFDRNRKASPNPASSTQRIAKPAKGIVDNRPQSVLQRKLQQLANTSPRIIHDKGIGKGLPADLKAGIEALSGHSLDDVRVHYNSSKPAEVGAHAYAQGSDIYLAPGQEKYLAHEAWHVVQQKQGRVRPTTQLDSGAKINDNFGLEREADRMGQLSIHHVIDPEFLTDQAASPTRQISRRNISTIIQRTFSITENSITKTYSKKSSGIQLPKKPDPKTFKLHGTKETFAAVALKKGVHEEYLLETLIEVDALAKSDEDYKDFKWSDIIEDAYKIVQGRLSTLIPHVSATPVFNQDLYDKFSNDALLVNPKIASIEEWRISLEPALKKERINSNNVGQDPSTLIDLLTIDNIGNNILGYVTSPASLEIPLSKDYVHDLASYTTVCKDMRQIIVKYLAGKGISLHLISTIINSSSSILDKGDILEGIKLVGDHILSTYPPNEFDYVAPGGSMVPVATYMCQKNPETNVISIPISGLSKHALLEDELYKDKRKFTVEEYGSFYQYYLGDYAKRAFGHQQSIAQDKSIKKLLLMDYSPSGNTLNTIYGQLSSYLESLGIEDPRNYIQTYGFNTKEGARLKENSTNQGTGSTAIEKLLKALHDEDFKENLLVLFEKPKGREGNFRGTIKDVEKQRIAISKFTGLWYKLEKILA